MDRATDKPSSHPHSSSTETAEAFFKRQLDAANKEKDQLAQRLRHVEDQNKALLKSLYKLSCTPPGVVVTPRSLPLDIVSAIREMSVSMAPGSDGHSSSIAPSSTALDGGGSHLSFGKGSAFRRSGPSSLGSSSTPPTTTPLTATGKAASNSLPMPSSATTTPTVTTGSTHSRVAHSTTATPAHNHVSINTTPSSSDPFQFKHTHGLRPYVSPAYVPFRHRADLKGHMSAVYAIQFSPDGRLLVSVSFDKTVRVWRVQSAESAAAAICLEDAHRAPIVAVEWTMHGTGRVATGSLDQTVAEWDVDTQTDSSQAIVRFSCDGLVNCVSASPAQPNILFVGTSKNAIHIFDRRIPPLPHHYPNSSLLARNDASVNTIHVTLDGCRVVTGDHAGAVKTWDLRVGRQDESSNIISTDNDASGSSQSHDDHPIGVKYNDTRRKPITHIHASPPLSGEEHGRLMAVNSYDAFLRVYDRDTLLYPGTTSDPPVHCLRGVINAHWPIKSSFFVGANYHPLPRRASVPPRRTSTSGRRRDQLQRKQISEGTDRGGTVKQSMQHNHHRIGKQYDQDVNNDSDEDDVRDDDDVDEDENNEDDDEGVDDDDDVDVDVHSDRMARTRERSRTENGTRKNRIERTDHDKNTVGGAIRNALILASGSADGLVYVFDVGARQGKGGLLQTLEGHKDRVYAVDFHPHEPILASCSADSDIKIWHAR